MSEDRQHPLQAVRQCSGCGRCVAACPERIITLELNNHRKHTKITNPECCTACGACIAACPLANSSLDGQHRPPATPDQHH